MAKPVCIPNELWAEVLKNLPIDELRDISLTCQTFRLLGLPHVFHTFRFHPYCTDLRMWVLRSGHPIEPKPAQIEREMQRLQFYASPAISLHVQKCSVIPWDVGHQRQDEQIEQTIHDFSALLNAFFDQLAQFSNLREIHCHAVNFTSFALSRLSVIPDIRRAEISFCNLPAANELPLPVVHVRDLDFTYSRVLHEYGVDRWLAYLDPNLLERINVTPNAAAQAFFSNRLQQIFPVAHTLSIAISPDLIANLPDILQQFPSLRRLYLSHFGSLSDIENMATAGKQVHNRLGNSVSSSPSLVDYNGPFELFQTQLVAATGMTSLCLWGFSSGGGCDPEDIARFLLSNKRQVVNLTFLNLKLTNLTSSFFVDIVPMIARVKSICIESSIDDDIDDISRFTAAEFLDELSFGVDTLPQSLERLVLNYSARDQKEANSKPQQFKDKLLERCSKLACLWLYDWRFSYFLWIRDESGEAAHTHPINSSADKFRASMTQVKISGPRKIQMTAAELGPAKRKPLAAKTQV